jgi:hypothetical protein
MGRVALSWQGNSFSSARAASGPTLTISDVESGDLVSEREFSLRLPPSSTVSRRVALARARIPFPSRVSRP